jgi:hypothetical protein
MIILVKQEYTGFIIYNCSIKMKIYTLLQVQG